MRVLSALIAAIVLTGCGGPDADAPARAGGPAVQQVSTLTVALEPFERTVTLSGTLAAEEEVQTSFRVTGRVEEILADLGSPVRKGQPLARLMSVDYELRVRQAEAALQQSLARLGLTEAGEAATVDPEKTALVRQSRAVREEAQLTRDRIRTFVERGLSSRADLDAASAALEVAEGRYQDALEEIRNRQALVLQRQSELDLAREQLDGTTLRSPIDGAVKERVVSVGEHRTPGAPVMTVVRLNPLRLRLAVPERSASALRAGQPVRVRVEGDPARHDGRLARLGAAIDESNRTLPVEAEVLNPRGALRPGTFVTADIVVNDSDSALVVPQQALVTFAGVQKVLTVTDGVAREQRVRLGRRADNRVEVVEGLRAGDVVVVKPGNLVDGTPVRAVASE
ncbi:MAG: efflux RND transporter periplasmic adaptor subunit [Vicinamibacterales bacterium]